MPANTKNTRVRFWDTVEYIGGGYVLQKRKVAHLELQEQSSNRRHSKNEKGALIDWDLKSISDYYSLDVSKPNKSHYNVHSLEDQWRVVHITELNGVDGSEIMRDMADRLNTDES